MIVFFYSLVAAITLISILLCFPLKIHLESTSLLLVQWMLVKIRIEKLEKSVRVELEFLNIRFELGKKKKKNKERTAVSAKKKKSRITYSIFMNIVLDSAVKIIVRSVFRSMVGILKAVKVTFLKWNIGLKDFYWQGITIGLLSALPRTPSFQISGNFEEDNNFVMLVKVSLWKLLLAVLLFLVSFPYIKAIRLYLNIRRQIVLST